MSELRIALVAEGKTDLAVIEAALKAIFRNRPFILIQLQPETSLPLGAAGIFGGGWGGVYRWCRQLVSMAEPASANPSLSAFDLIVLHVDADVAAMHYKDAGIADGRTDLPCQCPCPPAADSVDALRLVLAGWLDLAGQPRPDNWIFCIPSMSSEAWLVAALYGTTEPGMMVDIECNQVLETWLSQRPLPKERLIRSGKKQTARYRDAAPEITASWESVCNNCSQARRFSDEVLAAVA